jgi:hypothetical protein
MASPSRALLESQEKELRTRALLLLLCHFGKPFLVGLDLEKICFI